jgi:hypothetical protein
MATETGEVHLNRRGINSVEVPVQVEVDAGSTLVLRIVNHGSPLHISLSSPNSRMFTDFYHENLYMQDSLEYTIAIFEDAYAGFFDVDVITGYGINKGSFRVFVKKFIEKETPAPEPDPPQEQKKRSLFRWIPAGLLLIAFAAYFAWFSTGEVIWNYLSVLGALFSRQ